MARRLEALAIVSASIGAIRKLVSEPSWKNNKNAKLDNTRAVVSIADQCLEIYARTLLISLIELYTTRFGKAVQHGACQGCESVAVPYRSAIRLHQRARFYAS